MDPKGRYLISIDGGGTKTGICVFDCQTHSGKSIICGGGNYKTHGIETVRERIAAGIREILPEEPNIAEATGFLVMGISGCDSRADIDIYSDMMMSLGFAKERMKICNDSEMIFHSIADAPGICVVAGTGTVAFSFERNGGSCRAGGWGAPISDEGSGYWIGAEIIRRYLDWIDGIGGDNDFFRKIRKELNCSSEEDAAAQLAALDPTHTAEWAKPVFDAAPENDLCRQVITAAAEKTALLAASVYRKSFFEKEEHLCIVESGSLFKNRLYKEYFQDSLRKMLPRENFGFLQSDGIPAEKGICLAEKLWKKNGNNSIV